MQISTVALRESAFFGDRLCSGPRRLCNLDGSTQRKARMSRSIRVLCADDNADVLEVLKRLIDRTDDMCCVGGLSTADSLAERARELKADVVLVDATMPGKDPLVAMRELVDMVPEIRAVLFSGYDDPETQSKARAAGASECISKHADPASIVDGIRRAAQA